MKNCFSQKGVSLYLAFLIMTVLLSMALGLSVILVSQLKIIRGMSKSVIAFYSADTGIEEMLKHGDCPKKEYNGTLGEASYYVEVKSCKFLSNPECKYEAGVNPKCDNPVSDDEGCLAEYLCAKSVGTYKDTRRSIQVTR